MARRLAAASAIALLLFGSAAAQSSEEHVPKTWPSLEQARRHVLDHFEKMGRKPISNPATDRVAVVAVGQTRLATANVALVEGAFKPDYREIDVPEKDGVAVAMRASESLSSEDQKECAAKGRLARAVTLTDKAGHAVVVQQLFSDCLTPALMVGVRTAPGKDASFAEPLARAAMEAARRPRASPKPSPDAGTK